MADKILQTRIALKYDTLENWQNVAVEGKGGNLVLKAGEMGLVAIPTGSSLQQTTPPAVMFKVGDGTSAFKDLPWGSALAADVYSWAKASGVAVEVSGSGNVVTNMEWKATTSHPGGALVITKVSGKLTDTNTAHKHSAGAGLTIEGSITDWVSGSTDVKYKVALANETKNTNAAVSTPTANANRTYPVILDKNGKLATIVPWTDTTVTDTNQKVKAGTVTFGNNDVVDFVGGTDGFITVTGTNSSSSKQISFGIDTEGFARVLGDVFENTKVIGDGTAAVDGQYVTNVQIENGSIALTTKALPTLSKGTTSGNGNVITDFSVDGHSITATKGISVYSKSEVDAKVNGAVQYLGTVGTATALSTLTPNSKGDFCRASAAFSLPAAQSITGSVQSVHVSDMLVCEDVENKKYAIIHGEVDANTWVANTQTAAGYVAAGGTNYNKVWKTDASGVPAWREDANSNQTVKVGSTKFGNNDDIEIAGGSNVTVTADTTSKKITISATDTNTFRGVNVNGSQLLGSAQGTAVNFKSGNQITVSGTAPDVSFDLNISSTAGLLPITSTDGSLDTYTTNGYVKIDGGKVTSGSKIPYSDISGTPTIPTVYNGALKDKAGTSIFTANQNGDSTIIEINCGSSTTVI